MSGDSAVSAVNSALEGNDVSATLRALTSPALQLSAVLQRSAAAEKFYHDELRCMRLEKQVQPQHLLHVSGHTDTHTFNSPFSRTTRVSRYQKGKTNLDFAEARDGEWQWHQLGHMQVCTSLQTDNHASTPPLSFLQAGCPSRHPVNSVKALKAYRFLFKWL